MKKYIYSLFAAVLFLFSAGCSKDDDGSKNIDSGVVGEWHQTKWSNRDGEPWGASYAFELSGDGKTLTMISQTDKAEESVYTRTAIPEEVRNAPEVRSALSGALLRIF